MGTLVSLQTKAASNESAKIEFLGHSTVLITSEAGKQIIVDPWLEGNPSCPEELKEPEHIDYIFLTHGHSDHTASAVSLAKKHKAQVFATYELAMLLIQDGVLESLVHPVNKGGTIAMPDHPALRVTFTNAFHSSSYVASDGKTYYAGEACGIVVGLESNITVYHAGDTCLFSDMQLIGEQFNPDVALLPIGDRFTMGPQDAAQAVEWIEPKIAIPIHFGTFESLTGTAEEFSRLIEQTETIGITLKPGDVYYLTPPK